MATQLQVSIVGTKELQRRLKKMNPEQNTRIMRKSLIDSAKAVLVDATKVQILSGVPRKRPPGWKAHQKRLTSQDGTLRRSIGINKSELPFAITVGTNLKYGAYHELEAKKLRPFMGPALDKTEAQFTRIVVKHWKREGGL
jgi:phage gpG-like protein